MGPFPALLAIDVAYCHVICHVIISHIISHIPLRSSQLAALQLVVSSQYKPFKLTKIERAFTLAMPRIRAPTLLTAPSFLYLLSDDLQILFLSLWLDVRSLATFDVALF